jgi:peptide/nickel transport system substrate-binding protein
MIDLISRPDRSSSNGDGEPRSVNDLIQARIDGRISRRGLIRRAVQLGISAPVVGVMLHATSDMAFGAPSGGREAALMAMQEAKTIPADAPTKPVGTPQEGGTITTGTTDDLDTLHPYLTQLVSGFDVFVGITEGMVIYDSKQKLQPLLADSYQISDDGLTYTFKLHKGVKFQNGDDFTAQDVIDSWKIIMNKDFGAFNTQGWDKIKDVTAPDPLTVVMKTTEVYALFISYVGATAICPSAAIKKGVDSFKQDFGRAPIGTGPMKFVEWKSKESVTLEKNANYWGNKPKLDKIIFRIVPDDNTQLVQLRTGEIQMAASSGALGATRVDEALKIDTINVLEHPSQLWDHLDLKNIDFLRMTKVRQALDFATPSKQIIDQLLKGRALPCIADQAPGTWAYDPDIKPRPYDPDQAKKLLAEAGLKPGKGGVLEGIAPGKATKDPNATPIAGGTTMPFEMELWGIAGDATAQQIVEVISASWNSIGIKTTPKFESTATIWGPEGYQFTDKMTACLFSWQNSNDPDDMFYWHSSQIPTSPTGSGGNVPAYFFHYNFQDQIDKLTSEAAAEPDQEKRKQLYWQIQELLHEEVPVIFIYWQKTFDAVAKNVGGFWPSAFTNLLWNVQDWYLTK